MPAYPADRKEKYDKATQAASSPIFKRSLPDASTVDKSPESPHSARSGTKDNPAMSFVMLTESQLHSARRIPEDKTNERNKGQRQPPMPQTPPLDDPRQPISHRIESNTRLFEILSSRSDIDHPICADCTDLLLTALQARLSASTKERDAYISFLKDLKNEMPIASDVSKAEADLAAAKAKENNAFSELLTLEHQKTLLEDEIADLDAESRALEEEEQKFWQSRNEFSLRLSAFQEKRDALNAAYEHDSRQLERLQRTNVYNDTFCISHDGNFGTINGLRLGRLAPPNNIEWAEINASWGTTALLLITVANKLGFAFRGYNIKPMGSTTTLERLEYSPKASIVNSSTSGRTASSTSSPHAATTSANIIPVKTASLELFSSGDLPLGRTILHRRFNDAMVAFLECLRQLGEFVEHGEVPGSRDEGQVSRGGASAAGLKLPYNIEKDKIGGLSIKLGASQDDQWTSACKYTLTCCKFLLAHASNVAGAGTGSDGGGGRRLAGS